MNSTEKKELLFQAKDFFREKIVKKHIEESCVRAGRLSSYSINPFLIKYISNFLCGNDEPESIAKALVYPKVLGTSISTSFGMRFQEMISSLFSGMGSSTSGIDIEFIDSIDGRKKYCQLKGGPRTINADDVTTIKNHFTTIKNLARTNNLTIGYNDLIVGVLYGTEDELSSHYKKINLDHPVYVGQSFWYRLTGDENFYYELIDAFGEVALELDGREILDRTVSELAEELKKQIL